MTVETQLNRINGPNLVLRLIQPEDAEYLHALRMDPAYNRHLSEVKGTAEDQRRWIVNYKTREAVGEEFYYVIERHDGERCGVVRLYDIGADSFTWGSWILDHNKPRKAALESAILSFGVGFRELDLPRALVDVRVDNEKALSFYQRLGMTKIERTDRDIYFVYHRQRFNADRENYMEILNAGLPV